MLRTFHRNLPKGLSTIGVMWLGYVLGAAVMQFKLPTSEFLTNAFLGAERLSHGPASDSSDEDLDAIPWLGRCEIDREDKTFDGFTLCAVAPGNEAHLLNMKGKIVYKWKLSFNRIWPKAPQLDRLIPDKHFCIFDVHLYPNGDLLAVFHCYGNATEGCGLAKVDKDSHLLWKYDKNVHHDVDVDDEGNVYLTTQEVVTDQMKGLEFIRTPTLVDFVEVLSPEGKPLKRISIVDALHDSKAFFPLLQDAPPQPDFQGDSRTRRDVLHTNHVGVLRHEMAPNFGLPGWKAGQVLISMRHLNAIALLDVETGKLVWATTGPWKAQHDPEFLDNGHLLIFDNHGLPNSARVLEFNPKDGSVPWSYPGDKGIPFRSVMRGMSQRLPNGNTFIVNTEGKELLEVTPDQEIVWHYVTGKYTHFARRYRPDDLTFLGNGIRPR